MKVIIMIIMEDIMWMGFIGVIIAKLMLILFVIIMTIINGLYTPLCKELEGQKGM
jgi:hypothetical protein